MTATADQAPRITLYTTAPEGYDGFGTVTLRLAGRNRHGELVRAVLTPLGFVEWQRARYLSGLHLAADEQQWQELLTYKLATEAA